MSRSTEKERNQRIGYGKAVDEVDAMLMGFAEAECDYSELVDRLADFVSAHRRRHEVTS